MLEKEGKEKSSTKENRSSSREKKGREIKPKKTILLRKEKNKEFDARGNT